MKIEYDTLAALLYHKEEIAKTELDDRWFFDQKYKEIAATILETKGKLTDPNALYESIRNHNPATLVDSQLLENMQIDGYGIQLAENVETLKKRYYKERFDQTSRKYANYSNKENFESMKDALRELEELEKAEDDGTLNETVENLLIELETEIEPGILSYPKLDDIFGGGMFGGMLIVIGARPGVGKGNPNWVEIPTPNGNKKMGDIEVGDYVFDRYGKPTRVTGVYPRGKLETYKVTLNDGRSTVVDGDHIWSHFSKSGNGNESLINKTTSEMYAAGTHLKKKKPSGKYGHHAKYSIPTNGAVEFKKKEHHIDPYVIGALIGDGCLLERPLTISSDDEEVVQKVAELLNVEAHFTSHENYSWLFKLKEPIGRKKYLQTHDILADYPELTSYSYLKEIPREYLFSDTADRMRLLNGLFDTDGHAGISRGRAMAGYTTTSRKLSEQIRWLLQSCGYLSGVVLDEREGNRTCYNINVLGQAKDMEQLFTLERKRVVLATHLKVKARKYDRIAIKSIEKTGIEEEVTCISVENEEQLYLCNDFIVTHNTAYAMNVAMEAMNKQPNLAVDFVTLEMSKMQMIKRFISRMCEINSMKFRNPKLGLKDHEKAKVTASGLKLMESELRVHDRMFHIKDIERQIRRRHYEAKGKPYIAFIDYLGLVEASDSRQPRHIQVGEITRTLKMLTNELNIPIVLLSQLNRGIESRQDKKPNLSDLRESGSVEQDANAVLFIHQDGEDDGQTIVSIAKNREGFTGDIAYRFLKSKMYFEEL